MGKLLFKFRLWLASAFALLTNINISGFFSGKIYKGSLKNLCVPGLNCYSCPGAVGSCPIGSFQSSATTGKISFYVVGFLLLFGGIFGRFVCGFLCPFGLFQELLHKINTPKTSVLGVFSYFKYLKYIILVVFVVLMPLFLMGEYSVGQPAFCEYICPAGTIFAGLPLIILNENLRAGLGWLFVLKISIAIIIVVASVFIFRFFCRFLCPLGAFYGLFNKIAVFRFHIDAEKCTSCKACHKACPVGIKTNENPNDAECFRCGRCKAACKTDAIRSFRDGS